MSDIENTITPIEEVAAVAPKRARKAAVEVAPEPVVEAAPEEDLGELRDFGTVQFYIKG
jgi:hypothetical protein